MIALTNEADDDTTLSTAVSPVRLRWHPAGWSGNRVNMPVGINDPVVSSDPDIDLTTVPTWEPDHLYGRSYIAGGSLWTHAQLRSYNIGLETDGPGIPTCLL